MLKTFFAATALLAVTVSPAFAKDGTAHTFTRDGETYTYTTVDKGRYVLINGTRHSNGSTFQLSVRGSRVTGTTGGVPVSFLMPNAQAKLASTELAAN